MVNAPGNTFNYTYDYHLQDPVKYTGTDSQEVGLYGGFHSYKEGAVPSNPHIQFKLVAPQSDSNGLLNIQINAAAQSR